MTHKDFEEILNCSECSTALTDKDWSETYSVPLSMTIKEIKSLSKTLLTHEKLLNSNKHEPQVMPKIDELIGRLQVFGYTIRINNHNIGDIHNITIRHYEPIDKKREMFVLQQIDFLQLRLPSEADKLFEVFEKLLKDAEKP